MECSETSQGRQSVKRNEISIMQDGKEKIKDESVNSLVDQNVNERVRLSKGRIPVVRYVIKVARSTVAI